MAGRTGSARNVIIGALFVVIAGAGLGIWYFLSKPGQPSVDEGQIVASTFLEAIRKGDVDEAWNSTTAEFKSAEGLESFKRYVRQRPTLKKELRYGSTQSVEVGSQQRDEYLYQVAEGDTVKTARVLLGQEGDDWKVDRFQLD